MYLYICYNLTTSKILKQILIKDNMRLSLTTEEMNADFGNTYVELKSEYPNWAKDLHEKGHTIASDNLQRIFCRGLLLWYIRYCLKQNGLNLFIDINKKYTSFYETIILIKFFNETNPTIVDQSLLLLLKYDCYQSLLLTDKLKPCASFKEYSLKHNLTVHIEKLISEKTKYETMYKTICGEKSIETFIYDNLISTQIIKLGTIFQRWKIVLEQMCSKSKDKDDLYLKNMYLVDKFLIIVQEMILMGVKIYVDILKYTFMTCDIETYEANKINFSIIYNNNETYKYIFEEIQQSDILMMQVTDPENINADLIKLINLVNIK